MQLILKVHAEERELDVLDEIGKIYKEIISSETKKKYYLISKKITGDTG